MSSDSENKFAHLLQPIKDLADNWNIDIARELEDYLGDLEKITFSFDGEANSLNFAQAALVIQGSAVVYSKKVEYLYSLLNQTLDYLLEKKQKKTQKEQTQDGKEDNNDANEELEFLSLDDAIEEATGIDLVEGDKTPQRPRINIHLGLLNMHSNVNEPSEAENSNGIRKRDFKMNTAFMDSSGALVFDSMSQFNNSRLSGTPNTPFVNKSTARNSVSFLTPPGQDADQSNSSNLNRDESMTNASDSGGFELGPGGGADSDGDENDGAADDDDDDQMEQSSIFKKFSADQSNYEENKEKLENAGDAGNAENARPQRSRRARDEERPREKPKKRIVDMWAMLDPHEEVGVIKPFKKGKSYRIRPPAKPNIESDAIMPILSIAETPLVFRGVRGPAFPEFAYLYNIELKRRKQAKKRDRFDFSFEETVYAAAAQREQDDAEDEEEEHEAEIRELPPSDMMTHFNGATVDVEEEAGGFEAGGFDDDDDDDGDMGDANIIAGGDTQEEPQVETQTYEDYYAARVEKFVADTAMYAQETNLTKRVNDWKSKLAPVLEAQENHPNFDIQNYGDTLIGALKGEYEGRPDVTISEAGRVTAKSEIVVPFAKLTQGVEKYEVARRFAAVLQLVNNQNVSIVANDEIDSLSFHLLSIKPKYDIENYRAPSLNPFSSQPSSSQTSRKEDGEKEKGKRKARDEEAPKKGAKRAGAERGAKKGKKAAVNDKENIPHNKTKGKRKERSSEQEEEEGEEEEALVGPRTKMFTEVSVM